MVQCPALLLCVDTTRLGRNFLGDNPTRTKPTLAQWCLYGRIFHRAPLVPNRVSQRSGFTREAFINQGSFSQGLGLSLSGSLVAGALRETL